MSGGWSPHAAVLLAGAVVALGLAAYVWLRRAGPAGDSLGVVLAALAGWSLAGTLEVTARTLDAKMAWGDLKYVGIVLLPPAWLSYVLHYTGRGRIVTRRRLAALLVVPAITVALLQVDATHDLIRFYPAGAEREEFPFVAGGPLFWPFLVYTQALLLGGTVLLVGSLARTSRVYWRQSAALIGAVLVPWVVNLLYNLSVEPFDTVDFSPTAFVLAAAVLVWGVFRQHLLDLVPVARSIVVDRMTDAVVVLDAYGRVVDTNPAARRVLGVTQADAVGRTVPQLLPAYDGTASAHDVEIAHDGRTYDVTLTPLRGSAGRSPGHLLVLRDVTERRRTERALRRALAERSRIAETLERSLMPAALPPVPGVEVAARYRPAHDGTEVGGDFYDLYPIRDDCWAVVLGDVSGKGAEAASLTALARYTLRTLAMSFDSPAKMLTVLDEAVSRQADDDRFCTVALAAMRPLDDGVHLTLALGGHPQPLVARRDGTVEQVGVPGSLLGLLDAAPEPTEQHVVLAPGDVLLVFSDGVTEARRGSELFGEDRLAALLAAAAGGGERSADTVADAVVAAVLGFQAGDPRDDVALLVLRPD